MTPPLPDCLPPCAKSVPLMVVFSSAWMVMVPASPVWVADTLTLAVPSTVAVCVAVISTLPPPAGPRARVCEPASNFTVLAVSKIRPPLLVMVLASAEADKVPLCLIAPAISVFTAFAERIIKPPGAFTALRFSINASIVLGVVVMLAK